MLRIVLVAWGIVFVFIVVAPCARFQSGFTNWCPMMTLLRKMGVGAAKAQP